MANLRVCRICLATDTKLYYLTSQTKEYYEEVVAQQSEEKSDIDLPRFVCYECTSYLYRFVKFRQKCRLGLVVLRQILWKGPITYDAVEKINRKQMNLASPISKTNTQTVNYPETSMPEGTQSHSISFPKHSVPEPPSTDPFTIKNEVEVDFSENTIADFEHYIDDSLNADDIKSDEDVPLIKHKTKVIAMEITAETKEPKPRTRSKRKTMKKEKDTKKVKKDTRVKKDTKIVEVKKERKPQTKSRSAPRRERLLNILSNENNWKRTVLNEEEARKRFQDKENSQSYLKFDVKCTDCFMGFSREDIYKRHRMNKHNESLRHVCNFCVCRFAHASQLVSHMNRHYNIYNCLRCDFTSDSDFSANLHDDFHSGVVRKCEHCGEEYSHSSTYYTHLRTAHRSTHVCTICGQSFLNATGLHMHKTVKHIEDTVHDSPSDEERPSDTYCGKCDIRFETREAYQKHFDHSANHDEANEGRISDGQTATETKVLGKKVFRRQSKRRTNTKRQSSSNDDKPLIGKRKGKPRVRKWAVKPMNCYQCDLHFPTQAECMKHHRAAHPRMPFYSREERVVCEICGARLAPSSVNSHHNMHTKEKSYPCPYCKREFNTVITMKRHLVTHTGEKPFKCTACDKRFTQSGSMQLHYRTAHLRQPYPKRNRWKKSREDIDIPDNPFLSKQVVQSASATSSNMAALFQNGGNQVQYMLD